MSADSTEQSLYATQYVAALTRVKLALGKAIRELRDVEEDTDHAIRAELENAGTSKVKFPFGTVKSKPDRRTVCTCHQKDSDRCPKALAGESITMRVVNFPRKIVAYSPFDEEVENHE